MLPFCNLLILSVHCFPSLPKEVRKGLGNLVSFADRVRSLVTHDTEHAIAAAGKYPRFFVIIFDGGLQLFTFLLVSFFCVFIFEGGLQLSTFLYVASNYICVFCVYF